MVGKEWEVAGVSRGTPYHLILPRQGVRSGLVVSELVQVQSLALVGAHYGVAMEKQVVV
jgi:hypothetical protein